MKVLLLGDSHLARLVPYRRLIASTCDIGAVGGSTALDLAGQLEGVDPASYDVIGISVGTNDCGPFGVDRDVSLRALGSVLERVAPTPVLMINNPGADEVAQRWGYDSEAMRAYAEAASALVAAAGGRSLDLRTVIRPLGGKGLTPDGFHVSRVAHALVFPALRAALWRTRWRTRLSARRARSGTPPR